MFNRILVLIAATFQCVLSHLFCCLASACRKFGKWRATSSLLQTSFTSFLCSSCEWSEAAHCMIRNGPFLSSSTSMAHMDWWTWASHISQVRTAENGNIGQRNKGLYTQWGFSMLKYLIFLILYYFYVPIWYCSISKSISKQCSIFSVEACLHERT